MNQSKIALSIIPEEVIESKIFIIRNHKVMLDRDLAELYGVSTKALKQSVKRNINRFPEDFMFELTKDELKNWRSQFVTSNSVIMGLRYSPFAFTEQGVAMLSSVINSNRAINVNIQIIRTFTKLRELIASHKDIIRKIEDMERKFDARHNNYDNQFKVIFEVIRQMLEPSAKSKKAIGFNRDTND